MFIFKSIKLPFLNADTGAGGYGGISAEQFNSVFGGGEQNTETPVEESQEPILDENSEEVLTDDGGTPTDTEVSPKYKFKADGVEIEATIEDILSNYAPAGANYTRRSQELAQKEKEYAQIQQQIDTLSPYQQVFDMFQAFPQLETQFSTMIENFFNGNGAQGQAMQEQPNVYQDPAFLQLQHQNYMLQKQMQEFETNQRLFQETNQWNELKAQYPDADTMRDQVSQFAKDNGVPLEMAYRYINFENQQKKAEENLARNMTKKQVARTTTPSASGGNGSQPSVQNAKSYKEISDILAQQKLFNF